MESLNLSLLKSLCEIEHPSGKEQSMISYILNFCYKLKGINLYLDIANNLFITKNTTNPENYACVVAHLDEILKYIDTKCVQIKGNKIYGYYSKCKDRCGLGLDDTFGIYICLHLLAILPDLKVVLTSQEEMGCVGAETAALNTEFFDNCRFMLQADRNGRSDLITHTNGIDITSEEFLKDIDPLLEKYKYKEAIGTLTDVGTLKENINLSAVNISCGYYNAHTHKEFGNLTDLQKCLNFMLDIINLNNKVYLHESDLRNSYSRIIDYYLDGNDYKYCCNTSDEEFYENLAEHCKHCKDYDCEHCKWC